MGLFRRLGRKAEELKQEASSARENEIEARCRDCETAVYSDQETCPDCGSENLAWLAEQG